MTTPPVRAPRRDARANRESILSAATTALSVDPHASIDTIARGAGLSRRALYGHFEDRDTLVRELIANGASRFNDIALRIDDTDPRVALGRLTAMLWNEAAHVQVAASIALDEQHVSSTAEALAPLRRRVVDLVREGQAAGSLRNDVPAVTLARLIEETARTVITRMDAASPDALSLAVRAVLSISGLSWREAQALLAAHPDLVATQS
ncbi:TetR/AcrR family transcriptional regulator [Microbacterium sp. NPDC076911]|uniref:TetR/AcrR family transcriptional regulator n=1 Tax=Microbacterium sp. NPDC076911 TaxID=3154958 RepID=UPI0034232E1D